LPLVSITLVRRYTGLSTIGEISSPPLAATHYWTQIPYTATFTATVTARGGVGLLAGLIPDRIRRGHAGVVGAFLYKPGLNDTDTLSKISLRNTSSIVSGIGEISSPFLAATHYWTQIPYTATFTATVPARGGVGLLAGIIPDHIRRGHAGVIGEVSYKPALLKIASGIVREGTCLIDLTVQVGAGVVFQGSATLTGTATLSCVLSLIQDATVATINGAASNVFCDSTPIFVESGMFGGVLINDREVESPETISGSLTLDGVTGQFSDLYSGHYHRVLFWGFTSNPNGNFTQQRLTDVTGNDTMLVPLNVYNAPEEDVTPATAALDTGVTGWTSDYFSGALADYFGTIDNLTHAFLTSVAVETLALVDSSTRFTQDAVEVLFGENDSNVRETQVAVETLHQINIGFIQQEAVEALGTQLSSIRYAFIQQAAVEVLSSIRAKTRLSQAALSVFHGPNPDPPVAFTSAAVETLHQNVVLDGTPAYIQQLALESMRNADAIPVHIIHATIEALRQPIAFLHINHVSQEWVRNSTSIPVWVAHASQELVRDAFITPANINHLAVEMLVRMEFDPTVSSLINNPKVIY